MPSTPKRQFCVGRSHVKIGRFTYGFENISIQQWNEGASLTIGSFCSIANSVSIFLGGNHRSDWTTTFPFGHVFQEELGRYEIGGHPKTNGDVTIGSDVWLGSKATIMSGVTIGPGAVVAANSHVVKDVAPYEIVGGNPARPIKLRFDDEIIELLLQLAWWDLPVEVIRQIVPTLSQPPVKAVLSELIAKWKSPPNLLTG